jgi:hypothetical protein
MINTGRKSLKRKKDNKQYQNYYEIKCKMPSSQQGQQEKGGSKERTLINFNSFRK